MQDNSQNYGIRESTLLTFDLADGSYDGKYHPEDTSIVIRKHNFADKRNSFDILEKTLANRAGLQYDELTHPQKFHV